MHKGTTQAKEKRETGMKSKERMTNGNRNRGVPYLLSIAVASLVVQYPASTNAFAPTKMSRSMMTRQFHSIGGGDEANSGSSEGIAFTPGEATQRLGISSAPTVWTEFGRIAQEYNPVNLGQGFPDWLPPKFAVDSLVEAVLDSAQSPHQYTRPAGHPNLVTQLAKRYSIHLKQEIKPMEEVAVTVGASQALYVSLQTLIQPGK